ncbi:hypothetical protein A5819_003268 [Enterococcus sp. 7E2_DIV0204]|uniref:DUF554 domain-containing protein n=1 Tax=Candidatus Enterococcus lemimoniae TaxID=1834167 RepID=A0ABZ2T2R3_9ENTE|nr:MULTISPECIES: DUF554 domain-containing protein [unclassified Enterococcus]OTN86434.1 hypothetical protein A5819_003268 [Enterococcus sp. 7E2_DIV0204]OTO69600.1 hypothetical protein A5866_001816 [Enterococcus sp. 12C11_DIV0727]OTP48373.1 hypothetical protein A5884_003036 [Enterococcus sp. 7D2_DIV0200]
MILLGSLINGLAIVFGSLLGAILRNISEKMKDTVTKGIGLGVLVLGIQMAFKTSSFIVILISLCIGAMVGEALGIENKMNEFGLKLEKRFAKPGSNFADGFVTASLIFLIGSMGIIGAIESGVANNHQTLFTKAVMDGFMSIMLTATLGVGVLFSAVPVFLYQGIIALFASVMMRYIPKELLDLLMGEISAIGGLMIVGISLNIMEITKIRVSNYLPGLLILIGIITLQFYF